MENKGLVNDVCPGSSKLTEGRPLSMTLHLKIYTPIVESGDITLSVQGIHIRVAIE